MSAYFRWLVKRAHVAEDPFAGQSTAKARNGNGDRLKCPLDDAEAAALLNGPADPEIADAMRIAALSGLRIEEMYRLTVADCAGGWFNVRDAKSRAVIRRVPIHSALTGIIARRTDGKPATAYLFPEPGAPRPDLERSMAASKRFGHYRKRLGWMTRSAVVSPAWTSTGGVGGS